MRATGFSVCSFVARGLFSCNSSVFNAFNFINSCFASVDWPIVGVVFFSFLVVVLVVVFSHPSSIKIKTMNQYTFVFFFLSSSNIKDEKSLKV